MKICRTGHTIVAVCHGLCDANKALVLNRLVESLSCNGYIHLVADLHDCTGVDSSFVGTLMGLSQLLHSQEGHVVLNRIPKKVRRIMEDLGVMDAFTERSEELEEDLEMICINGDHFSMNDRMNLIKSAHEKLVAVDARNEERFSAFLSTLRQEMDQL